MTVKQYQYTGGLWLVTGVAGFIGSNIVEKLLRDGQRVRALDNFATGFRKNIEAVRVAVGAEAAERFEFIEGDIRNRDTCTAAMKGVSHVLHQAGLGSVPRSLADPITTNEVNVGGFLNVMDAARREKTRSFVYAASSSTYGDHPALPKVEDTVGRPLSPYAVTKLVNELYADVFSRCYGFPSIGLRYFNVFGARQDPDGAYAAVIPRWTRALLLGEPVIINGDGETSRDFCFVDNAVQANLLAAIVDEAHAVNQVYNVAVDDRTSLNRLFELLRAALAEFHEGVGTAQAIYADFRPGDIRHSQADIGKARRLLGYRPSHRIEEGIRVAMPWYVSRFSSLNGVCR